MQDTGGVCEIVNWKFAEPSRKDKCAAACGEPLRGPVVTLAAAPDKLWHMHCALTHATASQAAPTLDESYYYGLLPINMRP